MIGYLILAHHQPNYLADLVNTLNSPNAHFYVHIDGTKPLEEFQKLNLPNTTFLEKRVPVFWGGFNMVKATIKLINEALRNENIQRFCLLSGGCFPIKPTKQIEENILNSNEDFINVEINSPITKHHRFYDRFSKYHLVDNVILNPRNKRANATNSRKYLAKFLDSLPKKNLPKDFDIYIGSQWWCLKRSSIKKMGSLINEEFQDFFRYSWCSDEAFFQTLWVRCKLEYGWNEPVKNLHYVNWKQKGKIGSFPKTLDESDFNVLKRSGKLFARKFDMRVSDSLIFLIKSKLLN